MLGPLLALLDRPELHRGFAVGLLVAARLGPVMWLSPWLGLRSAPAMVRTGLHLAATVALLPIALGAAPTPPEMPWLAFALLREALLGAVFALIAAAPAYALDAGGRLVDLHRGANLADVLSPPTGERTSPLGDLLLLSTLAVFAALGGLRLAFAVLAGSFVQLPAGSVPQASIGALALEAAHALAWSMMLAAAFAAPAAVAIVLAEATLGVMARAMPRISVFFLGMPLRALLGLGVLMLGLPLIVETGTDALEQALHHAGRMLR